MPLQNLYTRAAITAALSIASIVPSALAATATTLPPHLAMASDHGRIDAAKQISITVYLKKENEAGFQKTLADLYDPKSSIYHKWLTDADLKQYEPTAAAVFAVRKELESRGLTIISGDSHHFTMRARGTVGNVEAAFGTEIHEFENKGHIFRANVREPHLGGGADGFVELVGGLENHGIRPLIKRTINLKTGKPFPGKPLSTLKPSGLSSEFTDQALSASQTFNLTTDGSEPTATYTGDVYDASNLPVGFLPTQLEVAYNLPAAYNQGLTGAGQTIVLLEAYGYPTAESDANAYFSEAGGVPLLTSSNYSNVYPDGMPIDPNAGVDIGWDGEIALDISSAHAIAPGAKILEVNAAGQDDDDFASAMSYIVDHTLGYTVSDSWEEDYEYISGPAESKTFDSILQLAAAKGISFQFSTGDDGDNGIGSPVGAAGIPSNAPHGTAVGGTTLLNTPAGYRNVPWGDVFTYLYYDGVEDPPNPLFGFFGGGSGGGISQYFLKPSWQSSLKISGRGVPDVSALADPQTGVPLVLTFEGTQYLECCYGGTSLASPIFTAFWAIADQKAGGPLGQAAPIASTLNNYHLTDVTSYTPGTQAAGSVTDSGGTTTYTDASLFAGTIYGAKGWTGTLFPLYDEGDLYLVFAVAFGLDTSLVAGTGWDDATGYGTPNGLPFILGAAAAK